MFPHLATRFLSRTYASLTLPRGLLRNVNARIVARSFLTTAFVAAPTTKTSDKPKATKTTKTTKASDTEVAPRKKRRSSAEVKADKAAKEQAKLKVAKAKAKAAKKSDPKARLKAPLKLIKIKKDERPPKPPYSAYTIFIKEQFAEGLADYKSDGDSPYPGVFTELTRKLSERWRNMSEEEKKPYREREQQGKDQHELDVAEWYKTADPRIIQAIRAQNKRMPVRPAEFKRPLAPYIKFHLEKLSSLEIPEGLTSQEAVSYRGKKTGEMWREVPEEEKKRLKDEFSKEMEEYRARVKQLQEEPKA